MPARSPILGHLADLSAPEGLSASPRKKYGSLSCLRSMKKFCLFGPWRGRVYFGLLADLSAPLKGRSRLLRSLPFPLATSEGRFLSRPSQGGASALDGQTTPKPSKSFSSALTHPPRLVSGVHPIGTVPRLTGVRLGFRPSAGFERPTNSHFLQPRVDYIKREEWLSGVPRGILRLVRVVPLTLKQANELIASLHRHHKPVQGHRFSLGAQIEDKLVGAAVVGRPVSREIPAYSVAEVTRLVTDGTQNACSFLYQACARTAKEMGFDKIQTYILEDEPGTSLKAAGWILSGRTAGGDWNHSAAFAGKRRTDQPMSPKQRWERILRV